MENQHLHAVAGRMCAMLSKEGHDIQLALMLSAIAEGFGSNNMEALDKFASNTSAQDGATDDKPYQMFHVNGVYTDNQQQGCFEATGRTPLESCFNAMLDRRRDFGLEIQITSVTDVNGSPKLEPEFINDIKLEDNDTLLKSLQHHAEIAIGALEEAGLGYTVGPEKAALQWLQNEVHDVKRSLNAPLVDKLHHLTSYSYLNLAENDDSDAKPAIIAGGDMSPSTALERLCDIVESCNGGIPHLEARDETLARHLYQVRAMCIHFAEVVDHYAYGFEELEEIESAE